MSRAVGLGKGSLKTNQRGSVCPWGEMMGRSLTVSYSLAATERASPLAGNNLFASRIFIHYSQSSIAQRKRQHRKGTKDFDAPRTNEGFLQGPPGLGANGGYDIEIARYFAVELVWNWPSNQ